MVQAVESVLLLIGKHKRVSRLTDVARVSSAGRTRTRGGHCLADLQSVPLDTEAALMERILLRHQRKYGCLRHLKVAIRRRM